MDSKLLDFIKELSLRDKKNLSQKALKVSEEAGELAKAVLPFENAYATNHRFSDKKKILTECADVILTAISIAYDLGYSHEEIEEVILYKATYWQELQVKEDSLKYPIPYEIHVTVEKPADIEAFKTACREIEVKPIVLDLENNAQSVMIDVMTSSHYFGDNRGSYEETKRISNHLISKGFNVLREKIETVPWHPAAPDSHFKKMPENCYFEAHVSVMCTKDTKQKLDLIAGAHGAHLSRNFFKKIDNDTFVNMITLRTYSGPFSAFDSRVKSLCMELDERKFAYEKVITEFAIYDTKVSHDFKWLDKK